jgi:hypothetical protein
MLAVAIAFIVSRSLGYGIISASSCRDARRPFLPRLGESRPILQVTDMVLYKG